MRSGRSVRGTPFAALTPDPPTIYFASLRDNSYLAGPSRCPWPRVATSPDAPFPPADIQHPALPALSVGTLK